MGFTWQARAAVLGGLLVVAIAALATKLAALPPFDKAAVVGPPPQSLVTTPPRRRVIPPSAPLQTHPVVPPRGVTAASSTTPIVPGTTVLPGEPSTPTGQWIATGTITTSINTAGPGVGAVEVQAWTFGHRACDSVCQAPMTRTPGDDSPVGRVVSAPGDMTGVFPSFDISCVAGSSNRLPPRVHAVQNDSFDLRWADHKQRLTADESGQITGCSARPGFFTTVWTATRLPQPAIPALPIGSQHAASAAAFVSAAAQVCTRVNDRLKPLAATIISDERTLTTQRGVAVATAATSLANTLPKLAPIATKIYSEIPQPPQPLDVLWVRAVQIERSALAPTIEYAAAVAREMRALTQYVLTENPVDARQGEAEAALAQQDRGSIPANDALLGPIEQQLHFPAICRSLPAYQGAIAATEA